MTADLPVPQYVGYICAAIAGFFSEPILSPSKNLKLEMEFISNGFYVPPF